MTRTRFILREAPGRTHEERFQSWGKEFHAYRYTDKPGDLGPILKTVTLGAICRLNRGNDLAYFFSEIDGKLHWLRASGVSNQPWLVAFTLLRDPRHGLRLANAIAHSGAQVWLGRPSAAFPNGRELLVFTENFYPPIHDTPTTQPQSRKGRPPHAQAAGPRH